MTNHDNLLDDIGNSKLDNENGSSTLKMTFMSHLKNKIVGLYKPQGNQKEESFSNEKSLGLFGVLS